MHLVNNMTTCRRSFSDPTISKYSDSYLEKVHKDGKGRRKSDITDFRSKRRNMQDNLLQLEKRINALKTKDSDLKRRQQRLQLLLLDVMSHDEALTSPTCAGQSDLEMPCSCVSACDCLLYSGKITLVTQCSDRNIVNAKRAEGERHHVVKTTVDRKTPEIISTDVVFDSTVLVTSQTSTSDLNILSSTSSYRHRHVTYCKRLKHFVLRKVVCCSKP